MNSSSLSLNSPIHNRSFNVPQNPKIVGTKLLRLQFSFRFLGASLHRKRFRNVSSAVQLRNDNSVERPLIVSSRVRTRVSSNDKQFGLVPEENEIQAPSFAEFITSERVKVIAMLALALALCNADRVVMSVVMIPLSLAHGWSRSFSGIVQVVVVTF